MPYEQRQRLPDDPYSHPEDPADPLDDVQGELNPWEMPRPRGMTKLEWYQSTFKPPQAPDGNLAFSGGRESRHVVDKRGEPMGVLGNLNAAVLDRSGYDLSAFGILPRVLDNRHTQAVDGLVARLAGYQSSSPGSSPSRAKFIAPNNVHGAVAADMQKYYGEQDPYDRIMSELEASRMTAAYGKRH